jgi:hypothetical protein
VLRRRVRLVVAATITYNAVEAVVALSAGAAAGSSALIGFGLDSLVEILSAGAVAWQFAGGRNHEDREHVVLRVVAFSFFALAAVVSADALRALLGAGEAEHSTVGIALAAVSLAVMPALSWFERRTGRELGSASASRGSRSRRASRRCPVTRAARPSRRCSSRTTPRSTTPAAARRAAMTAAALRRGRPLTPLSFDESDAEAKESRRLRTPRHMIEQRSSAMRIDRSTPGLALLGPGVGPAR